MHSTIIVPAGQRPKPSLCRLRQKRKILPSDNLSLEKDFPRFYAKCRNRQSSDGNSDSETDSASRSISPLSSEEEYSSAKQRLCRLSDPMRDMLNEKHRLNSLTVEIHKLNKSYRHLIDINNNSVEDLLKDLKHRQILEVESPLSSNMATCISINCWDDCLTGTKFGKLKSRLSQVSLSDSGYASNPDLTESTELLETKDDVCKNQCDSPPCEVSCGFESLNYGEFNVSHQPEKVVIQILPHFQNMPEIRKRPLSRCTMKINSEERSNDGFDYFSNQCIQTLDQCTQSECGSPKSVCSDTMQSSDILDCFSCVSPVNEMKFLEFCDPLQPLQVQNCQELSVSLEKHLKNAQTSLENTSSHKQVSKVTLTHDSDEELAELLHDCLMTDDKNVEVTNRLSDLDVFLVQDSWLMFAEGDRPTSGKVPYVIFAHKKGDEPRGRWALMQEVLSENGKSRIKSSSVQN